MTNTLCTPYTCCVQCKIWHSIWLPLLLSHALGMSVKNLCWTFFLPKCSLKLLQVYWYLVVLNAGLSSCLHHTTVVFSLWILYVCDYWEHIASRNILIFSTTIWNLNPSLTLLFWISQAEADVVVCVNDPLLTDTDLKDGNLLTITAESAYSVPEAWNPSGTQYMYNITLPMPLTSEVIGNSLFSLRYHH